MQNIRADNYFVLFGSEQTATRVFVFSNCNDKQ